MKDRFKILYVSSDEYGSLTWSLERAFRDLGCDVSLFESTGSYELGWLGKGSIPYRLARRAARPILGSIIEQRLLWQHSRRNYDLILCHKTMDLSPSVMAELRKKTGAKLFCFYPDHPFHNHFTHSNENSLGLIPVVDCYFIWGKFIMDTLRTSGARKVEFLPFAHDPELHHPIKLDAEERAKLSCEIAFIGGYSKERAEWLIHVLDRDVGIWGSGWERAIAMDHRFKAAHRGGNRVGVEFAKVYSAAKIGLNLIQVYGNGHNMRTYEAPACGGFVMSNRTEELVTLFKEDEELVCFSSPKEFKTKVAHYLDHPEERERIARAGFEKVRRETYLERAKRILDVMHEERESERGPAQVTNAGEM